MIEQMEQNKNEIDRYLDSGMGIPYLKSADFKVGDEMRYIVTGAEQKQFEEDEAPKMMLILSSFGDEDEVGLVLNKTNLKFIREQGFMTFSELKNLIITIRKEVRPITYIHKGEEQTKGTIGLFVVSLEKNTNRGGK